MGDENNSNNLHITPEEDDFKFESVSMVSSSIVPSEVAWAALQRRQHEDKTADIFHTILPSESNQINSQIQFIQNLIGKIY